MLAIPEYETYPRFTDRERAAIALATELTRNPQHVAAADERLAVGPATRARLKALFDDAELVELVTGIAAFNFLNRFNRLMNPEIDVEPVPAELLALLKAGAHDSD